ncbi:MAG: hypothetical protein EOO15_08395 [Chitinophagaceae bacterium]|nr:MAG: hypothetical protein EOO15_08395 [Chitinophagaceae bacterium]
MNPRKPINKWIVSGLLFSAVVLLGLNLVPFQIDYYGDKGHPGEKFSPQLVREIRSVDQMLDYTDRQAREKSVDQGSVEYSLLLLNLVETRFMHGYCCYRFSQNWMASLSGLVSRDYAAIVLADDILKFPNAACSQQSIVMMEALRRKGFDVRKILFPTHFAFEARIGGKWYFFDPDVEPNVNIHNMADVATIANSPNLNGIYEGVADQVLLHKYFDNYRIGPINAQPAPNAAIFHQVTYWLSKLAFLFPLFILYRITRRRPELRRALTPVVSFRTKSRTARVLP